MPNGDPQETDVFKIVGGKPAPEEESILGKIVSTVTSPVGTILGPIVRPTMTALDAGAEIALSAHDVLSGNMPESLQFHLPWQDPSTSRLTEGRQETAHETMGNVRRAFSDPSKIPEIAGELQSTFQGRPWKEQIAGDLLGALATGNPAGLVNIAKSPFAVKPTTKVLNYVKNAFVSSSDAKHIPTSAAPSVTKLISGIDKIIKQVTPLREVSELARTKEKGRRIAALREQLENLPEDVRFSEGTMKEIMAETLGGKLPTPGPLLGIWDEFTPDDVIQLREIIWNKSLADGISSSNTNQMWELVNNMDAFDNLLLGTVPTPDDIARLSRMFGSDLAEGLAKLHQTGMMETFMDVANIPRTLLSSYDFSAPFRQGWMLGAAHPRQFWVEATPAMFKVAFSKKNAFALDEAIRSHSDFWLANKVAKVYYDPSFVGEVVVIGAREERFASNIATKIPILGRGVKASQRAYVGFLNKLRHDVFYNIVDGWRSAGLNIDSPHLPNYRPELLEQLGHHINILTGRGTLGSAEKIAPLLNATFFAPKFAMSRFQSLTQAGKVFLPEGKKVALIGEGLAPEMKKVVAKDLVSWFGTNSIILGILSFLPGVTVELDPRSSEFGKGKIGNARFDFWSGMQPVAVYLARLTTNQIKESGGFVKPAGGPVRGRVDVTGRFARSKASPLFGAASDLNDGETFLGAKLRWDADTIGREAFERLAPLSIQDLKDAMWQDGSLNVFGAPRAVPAFFGIGVQIYKTTNELRDEITQEYRPGMRFTDIKDAELRQKILDDDRYINKLEENKKLYGTGTDLNAEEQIKEAFAKIEIAKAEAATIFLETINANPPGAQRRWDVLEQGIQAFYEMRADKFDAAWDGYKEGREQLNERRDQSLLSKARDEYWSIQPSLNPETGYRNYQWQKEQRELVINKYTGGDSAITPEDIKYKNPNRFKSDLDPEGKIKAIIEQYESDMDILKWYNNLPVMRLGQYHEMYATTPSYETKTLPGWPRELKILVRKLEKEKKRFRLENPYVRNILEKYNRNKPLDYSFELDR
jgi:hypothetical protein